MRARGLIREVKDDESPANVWTNAIDWRQSVIVCYLPYQYFIPTIVLRTFDDNTYNTYNRL